MLQLAARQKPAGMYWRGCWSSSYAVATRPAQARSLHNAFPMFRPSLDPLKNKPKGEYKPGEVFSVHSPEELEKLVTEAGQKLVVLMCKASHCKPCKKFGRTYSAIAEHCKDTMFLEISGDETMETRKLMMQMGVKSTPTFRFYRDGRYLEYFTTGAKKDKLLSALAEKLKPGEASVQGLQLPEDEDE